MKNEEYININEVAKVKGLKSNRSLRIAIQKGKYIAREITVQGGKSYEIKYSSLEVEIQEKLEDEEIKSKSTALVPINNIMFFEVARILKDKRPRYFILENVKGLLNHDGGKTFQTILKVLSDLGYQTQWQLLNSKFFGVPQNRERVYIVGCYGKECIGKIFPIQGSGTETINEIRKHPLTPKNAHQGSRIYTPDGIGSCLIANAGSGKTGLYFINKPRFDKYKASDTVETLKVGGDTPCVCVRNGTKKRIGGRGCKAEADTRLMPPTKQGFDNFIKVRNGTKAGYDIATIGDGINLAYPQSKTRRGRVGKGCSQTLDTNCNMGTLDGYKIRRLTPLECFRLQGFPDDMVQKAREIGLSDARLYKMAGNAVSVNVVEAVAKKLAEVCNDRT